MTAPFPADHPILGAAGLRRLRRRIGIGPHPRLFVGPEDRVCLLDDIRRGGLRAELAERLRERCRALCDPANASHLRLDRYARGALHQRPAIGHIVRIAHELAFAGWLWDEPAFSEGAGRIVLRWAREAPPVAPGADPCALGHLNDLDTGRLANGLAWALDFLWPRLSPPERDELVRHARDYYLAFVMHPYTLATARKSAGSNAAFSAMGNVGLLALAVAETLSDDELGRVLGEALQAVNGYLHEGMDDDGGAYEGPGYGHHMIGDIVELAEALRRLGAPALAQHPILYRYGRWIASMLTPGGGTVAVGDSIGAYTVPPALALLARRHGDAGLQWAYLKGLGRRDLRGAPFGDPADYRMAALPPQIIGYDAALAPRSPDALGWPPCYFARGSDYVTLRDGWAEQDLLAVVSGCGRRAASETHLGCEAGAVSLWALGEELLHDPGYGFDTADAHSTVEVSGRADPPADRCGGNARFGARVTRFVEGPFAAFCTVDMAQQRDCRRALRDVALIRGPRPYLIVADDLNYRSDWSDYDWYWIAHPEAALQLPDGEAPARIRKGQAMLCIRVLTPQLGTYPRDHELRWSRERVRPWSHCGYSLELDRLRLRVSGYTGVLLSVLVPLPVGAAPPRLTRLACPATAIAARLEWGVQTDTLIFSPHNRFLQAGDVRGNGRLTVVREVDGAGAGHLLVDGYDLSRRGRALVRPRERAGHYQGGGVGSSRA